MKIFISSTSEDLEEHRLAAAAVIRDAQCVPIGMEHFPADPRPIVQLCRDEIATSDLVILLQAFRKGWVPGLTKGGDADSSITAIEISAATELGRPVLAFLADENWPGRLWDDDASDRTWTKGFRNNLNRNAKFFRWEDDPRLTAFRALLSQELANYRSRSGTPSPIPPAVAAAVTLRRPRQPALPSEPYPLLGPYEHPATFAGRDTEIEKLAALVALPPLVLCVHAPSGAGKSSLLLAGLVPRLREEGYAVSIDRAPGDPQLAQRLLRDLVEPSSAVDASDDDADLPADFAGWVTRLHDLSGKPLVFVLDQIDDVLRSPDTRDTALARLGVLMAATSQRLPGEQGFACKWVLCYRHEFHGEVRAWLEDVLSQARALRLPGLAFLPHDLSSAQKSHDWAMPVMGKPAPGERGIESSQQAFLRAIEQPLRLEDAGLRWYPYTFSPGGAARLAAVFAQARQTQPDAPLVPELQVVLSYMLGQAHRSSTTAGPTGDSVVDVPSAEELEKLIGRALTDHVGRALDRAFPQGRDTATGRTARTRALMALRHLADAEGRRGHGLPEDDLARMIGDGGREVLARLSAADARLVVVGEDGRVTLSHDRLAEVIVGAVRDEAARGNLLLDQGLLDAQRTIAQKLALFQGDPKDESALTLTHPQQALIRENQDALLVDAHQRAWWGASETYRRRRTTQLARWGAASVVVMLAASFFGYRLFQDSRISSLRAVLVQTLSVPEPDFTRLASVVADRNFRSDRIELEEAFVRGINPEVFAAGPWLSQKADPTQVMDVIERAHLLFVSSRPLFGAMSFALEEVFVRSGPDDSGVRERARVLADTVRRAFIAHHKERTPGFQEPPARAEGDPLNELVAIPPGEFVMGSEGFSQPVLVSAFRMQRHEVTNDEYKRFDPALKFPSGEERHPVARVSWHDAAAYAAWLGASLPTEAEWEYAARGTGSSSGREFPWPEGPLDATRAVFGDSSTEPVGSRPAGRTPEGLDDMAGNVEEWCRDWYGPFSSDRVSNPLGAAATADGVRLRVLRGGSFSNFEYGLRAADRNRDTPDNRDNFIGFRVVSSRLRP